MNARQAAIAPIATLAMGPARLLLGVASIFFWLLGLGSVVGMGVTGVGPGMLSLWIAGLGVLAVRSLRQKMR